jgi:hypothetical protein
MAVAPMRARALAVAALPTPWAALMADQHAPSWRIAGAPMPPDDRWLLALAQHAQGRWVTMPAASPEPHALDVVWLQGETVAAHLWLGARQATWCTPQAGCQTAPLSEEVATDLAGRLKDRLKDALEKTLPR